MKRKNFFLEQNKIDLIFLLKVFWKNKILFIFIPIFFLIFGYLIAINIPKHLTTTIKIDKLTNSQLRLGNLTNQNILNYDFFHEFTSQVNFNHNLINFIESKNRYKSLFNKKDFSIKVDAGGNYELIISIDYKEGVEGKEILQNYLEYTLDKVSQDYFEIIKNKYRLTIQENEKSFLIAKLINLDVGLTYNSNTTDGSGSYSKGYKVLELEIQNLKNDLKKIEKLKSFKDLTPNWKFILLKDTYETVKYPKKFYFMLVGFFIGLCFSFAIIFFNSVSYPKKITKWQGN
jgi:LPS O-antigen subunit length determinant protein (WzzB/FepE family)